MSDELIYVLLIGASCTIGIFLGLFLFRRKKK